MSPKTTVDMRLYACHVVEGSELMLALLPASPSAKKSWYLRAVDAESFETWHRMLKSAAAGAHADAFGHSASPASKSTVL